MCLLEIKKSLVYFITAPKVETPSHLLAVLSLLLTVNQEKRPGFPYQWLHVSFFLFHCLLFIYDVLMNKEQLFDI